MTLLLTLLACPEKQDPPDETDTDTDADTDADTDTDTDTDTDPDWAHCADTYEYVGESSWSASLEATSAASYCALSNEERSLEEEVDAKARLHVQQGTWPMPHEEGDYALTLPVCTILAGDDALQAGEGSTTASPSTFGGITYTYLNGSQPLSSADGTTWAFDHTMILVGDEGAVPDPLVLDGAANDASTGSGVSFSLYEEGGSIYDRTTRVFGPCLDSSWIRNVHTVSFDGGEITLEAWIGVDLVITAPAMLTRATGTLDGTSFDVDDYFQLIYRPGHHHFGRDFAVFFDAPIGDACALRIEAIDALEGTTTATVSTADCDLVALESRTVTDEGWEVE